MDDKEDEEFIKDFRKQLAHVDETVQLFLNGHLSVETSLDSFLDEVFFHPKYLEKARLGFFHKVHIARAYCEVGHARPEWDLMLELHTVRNKLAHQNARNPIKININRFRELLKATVYQIDVDFLDPQDLIVNSVAVCGGYLDVLRDQLREARGQEPTGRV